jgi:hypothetical protein
MWSAVPRKFRMETAENTKVRQVRTWRFILAALELLLSDSLGYAGFEDDYAQPNN